MKRIIIRKISGLNIYPIYFNSVTSIPYSVFPYWDLPLGCINYRTVSKINKYFRHFLIIHNEGNKCRTRGTMGTLVKIKKQSIYRIYKYRLFQIDYIVKSLNIVCRQINWNWISFISRNLEKSNVFQIEISMEIEYMMLHIEEY